MVSAPVMRSTLSAIPITTILAIGVKGNSRISFNLFNIGIFLSVFVFCMTSVYNTKSILLHCLSRNGTTPTVFSYSECGCKKKNPATAFYNPDFSSPAGDFSYFSVSNTWIVASIESTTLTIWYFSTNSTSESSGYWFFTLRSRGST